MFEEAKQLAEQAAAGKLLHGAATRGAAAVAELMGRQAAWSEETANYEAAAEMYIKVRLSRGAMLECVCVCLSLSPPAFGNVSNRAMLAGACRPASMSAPSACS